MGLCKCLTRELICRDLPWDGRHITQTRRSWQQERQKKLRFNTGRQWPTIKKKWCIISLVLLDGQIEHFKKQNESTGKKKQNKQKDKKSSFYSWPWALKVSLTVFLNISTELCMLNCLGKVSNRMIWHGYVLICEFFVNVAVVTM